MSERRALGVVRGAVRNHPIKGGTAVTSVPQMQAGRPRLPAAVRRLISWPDAANSRDLQKETRVILATLMPHEQQVLRMRFGIGAARYRSVEEIARHYALGTGDIRDIEAQALRKLRHPGGRSLKSVSRR